LEKAALGICPVKARLCRVSGGSAAAPTAGQYAGGWRLALTTND